jgi:hypothetical protein
LGNEVKLPLAFFREKPRPKVRRSSDGRFELSEETWPRLGHVQLTGKSEVFEDERYFETREPGMWVRRSDASIVEQTSDLPKQVAKRTEGRRSWLDISILKGTLVAYEYDQPLYATLISPGRGGLPVHGVPTLETASTPTGAYSVLGKFVTATMVSSTNSSLVHAEVQYTQNFTGPYALHGAYWHNDWGQWKSGGCVNLSPIDSRRIFRFTEPRLPDGWHGMRTIDFGYKTIVYVHR